MRSPLCYTHTEGSEEIWRNGASRQYLDQAPVFEVGARKYFYSTTSLCPTRQINCTAFALFLPCFALRHFGGECSRCRHHGSTTLASIPQYARFLRADMDIRVLFGPTPTCPRYCASATKAELFRGCCAAGTTAVSSVLSAVAYHGCAVSYDNRCMYANAEEKVRVSESQRRLSRQKSMCVRGTCRILPLGHSEEIDPLFS